MATLRAPASCFLVTPLALAPARRRARPCRPPALEPTTTTTTTSAPDPAIAPHASPSARALAAAATASPPHARSGGRSPFPFVAQDRRRRPLLLALPPFLSSSKAAAAAAAAAAASSSSSGAAVGKLRMKLLQLGLSALALLLLGWVASLLPGGRNVLTLPPFSRFFLGAGSGSRNLKVGGA